MTLVAFDIESHKIQPGLLSPPICCGAFAFKHSSQLHDRETALNQLVIVLAAGDTIAGQNIAYDFGCVLYHRPELFPLIWKAYEEGRVHDIGITATLNALGEGRLIEGDLFLRDGSKAKGRYSLDMLVKEWLGRDDAKANARFRTSYALLEGIPISDWPEDARQYPIDDVTNTLEVAEAQLKGPCLNLHDMPRQAHTAFCLHLGAMWGLRTDAEAVEKFATATLEQQAALKQKFLEHGIYRYEGPKKDPKRKITKDTKKLKALVEAAYLGSPPRTETGGVSTDRVTLEESHDPLLEELASVSKIDKLATYIPALREATQKPLNVRPNVLLSTGRSSYEGLIQLLPRRGGVRDCFVPRPGRVFSSVDYAAVELSTLAQVCIWTVGESVLGDAINQGLDPHSFFAARMVGMKYEDFMARRDAEKALKDKRQAAKACFAADTLVLTPRGWVPIVQVTTQDLVWDGEQWVSHQGVLDQGVRLTERFAAVAATPDHEILTGHGWRAWSEVRTNPSLFQSALASAISPSSSGIDECTEVESSSLKPRLHVYDLLNAGPRHRFTILTSSGPIIVSNCNFGFPGMMGASKFVVAKRRESLRVCELIHRDGKCGSEKALEWKGRPTDYPLCVRCLEEAEALRNFYLEMWPEVPEFWAWIQANIDPHDDGLVQFISKRRRAGVTGPSGANTMFQGLAADGAKAAVIALTKEMYDDNSSPLYGSRLVVFSHDETILEIPEERAHEAAHRQAEVMVAEMKKYVPDVKVSAAPALMTKWLKDAEPVYNEGRLVPWEPKQ